MEFQVDSSKLYVSDPGYDKDPAGGLFMLAYRLEHCKNGTWKATIVPDKSYPDRVNTLKVMHSDHKETESKWEYAVNLAVDYGLMSIFDDNHYPDSDTFMEEYSSEGIVNDRGVVCSSGFGDGSYPLYVMWVNSKVIGAKVMFINDEKRRQWERLNGD